MSTDNIFWTDIGSHRVSGKAVHRNFEERSDIAQEIISRKPGFYEKWALLLFLLILLVLTIGTWFIKYPDIIKATAVLSGNSAPKEIIAKRAGRLTALFIKPGRRVKQGEILGWLEATADTKEVISLSKVLDSAAIMLNQAQPEKLSRLFRKRFSNLGELQGAYQTFTTAWLEYNDYVINGFYARRKGMLHGDIASLQSIQGKISQQKELTTEDNELAQKTFEMNKTLYEEKVISAEEYRRAQSSLLSKQMNIPQSDVSIISQQNQIRDKQKEIDQLNHDILQQGQTFDQALQTLKTTVDDWLRNYTLQAPTDGTIVFTLPLQENQHIDQGKLLGFVNPENSTYYAELRLPQNNFGKVDTGMKVQLRFDAYPYQEVGFVPGTLNYISAVAVDSAFLGTVRLDGGLKTNQKRTLQYKNGLKAEALIITKDMRLLERLFYSILKETSAK